jgi:hypothetical protein
MGGLVARYFLEVLGGWRDTRMLITLGTPYRGSVKALAFLANGLRRKLGPVTIIDLTRLIQSLPSVYQLLPIYPCLGTTEDELQGLEAIDRRQIGELDIERACAGIEFHREIESAVKNNRRERDYGYRILPIVGTYQPTFQSALLLEDGIEPLLTYKRQIMLGGDGTVPRLSATPIELSKAAVETFVACPHASLQNFDPVRIQMRAALEDVDISEIKAGAGEGISLEISDAFPAGEEVRFRVRCQTATEPIQARASNLETRATIKCDALSTPGHDGWQELNAGYLAAGTYRLHVDAEDAAEPFSDLFVVM